MIEIMIHLEADAKTPLYEQIYNYIKKNMEDGKISRGEKLPSTRFMAKYLQISRSTVELAYEQLRSEGYIESVPCKGYFICDIAELYRLERHVEEKETAPIQNTTHNELQDMIDFTINGVDKKHFPFNIWRKLHKDILLEETDELLSVGDSQGEYGLRESIAHYLYQARGVNCTPEQLVIGAGNEYLLLLLAQLFEEKKKVAMENPTYLQAYHTFCNIGWEVQAIPAEGESGLFAALGKANPDVVYSMPSHQFPLGTVMPMKKRLELLHWASEQEGRYLIEDDHDSEYRYKGKPIPSLQSIDNRENVIYLGTFSASIAPSVRVSYMVLPKNLLEIYQKKCDFYSTTVPKLSQKVLRRFIEEGHFGRHLNKMRSVYRNKHDILLSELKKYPWVGRIRGENAGLHLLAELNTNLSEKEIEERALQCGLKIEGLLHYDIVESRTQEKPVLLFGYGDLPEDMMRKGLCILDDILRNE